MKILVVCQYYYPEQFRINDICEELVKEGNEVTILTGLPNYPEGIVPKEYKFNKKRKEKINGVNVIRCFEIGRRHGILFRMLNYFSFEISGKIKAKKLKEEYDQVLVYQLSPIFMAIPAIAYTKKHNTNLTIYCLDLWPQSITVFGIKENSIIYKIIAKKCKKIYNSANRILITSNTFKKYFEKICDKQIEIGYLPQYAENKLSYKEQKQKEKYFNYVFAGNIGKAQGTEIIIKAANELRENEDIKFHIIGAGSELESCKLLAKKYNLQNITFYGKKTESEMQPYYDMADAMIVTLIKDEFASMTLPGKVQACMLTGNAVIASANGEAAETIKKAECGYVSEAENYKKLAENILKFSTLQQTEKEKMRKNAHKYYMENFAKQQFFESLNKYLKNKKEGLKNV